MTDATFDVIFSGKLQAGADPAQVREQLARLFKVESAKLTHLFTGQPVPVKRGVDTATALQYQAAFAKAGALVELIDCSVGTPSTAPPEVSATTPPAAPASRGQTLAGPREAPVTVPPAIAARSAPPAAPDYSIAEAGATLVEATTVVPPVIDTAHLSVAAAGELLVEPETIIPPVYDLAALSLDPPGTTLSDAKPAPPPQYDLSALALES